jgi:hypothetical protein
MPLKKLLLKAGVNKENTRYTNENGWYISDKVRFRQGTPEKIGGWVRVSAETFLGVCRSLWNWVTLGAENLMGVGTNLKYYIERDGAYFDITPIRETVTLTNPFTATNASSVITVSDTAHGCLTGDFVTFSGSTTLGGNITASVLDQQFQVTVINTNSYTISVSPVVANATDASGSPGGGTVSAAYQINTGSEVEVPLYGWGAGTWGVGVWGTGGVSTDTIRLWSANNWGEDLVFGPRGGGLYYWDATNGVATRGVNVNTLGGTVTFTIATPCVATFSVLLAEGTAVQFSTTGALPTGLSTATTYYLRNVDGVTANLSATPTGAIINTSGTQSGTHSVSLLVDVPTKQNYILVSDTSRFVLLFGTTDYGSSVLNPMLIRWSNQESVVDWYPGELNQSRTLTLSHGSEIITALQTRQEIVVFTDSSIYSLQYVGPPVVWSSQLLADNISIISQNAAATASGVIYWMGVDKFYSYSGRVQTLRCDLRRHVFGDINTQQFVQVYAGTNEGFNEIWWFYPSSNSNQNNRYVVYNYLEDVWYYGSLGRTAWIDSGLRDYPQAATYSYNLVSHELGVDDGTTGTLEPIVAYIESAEFDIEDGQNFGFVWRMLPDVTFQGSTAASPQLTMTLYGMNGSGSGFNQTASKGVTRTSTAVIEQFTNIIYTRIRGRQMIMKAQSDGLGVMWQLGAPRIDVNIDGQR